MHVSSKSVGEFATKSDFYDHLLKDLQAIFEGERDWIANTANCSAILYHAMTEINWAGFYFQRGADLVLGPFQGKPACVRIGPGRGVCGAAALKRQTLIVPNVHEFPGHIACDSASNSEIVLPLVAGDRLLGVLDIDSPKVGRFEADDATGLQAIVALLLGVSELPDI